MKGSHLTKHVRSNFLSRLFFQVPMLLLSALLIHPSAQADNDKENKNKDKVKFRILQNEEYNDCKFKGEVVISVKYRLKSMDYGVLTAELTEDGQYFYEVASLEVEKGKSKVNMMFDAGDCASDLRVTIK